MENPFESQTLGSEYIICSRGENTVIGLFVIHEPDFIRFVIGLILLDGFVEIEILAGIGGMECYIST